MAKLLGLSLGMCLLLTLLIGGARVLGQQQTLPSGLAQFHLTDCRPPCWIGIVPGSTTIAAAKARIIATFGGRNGFQIKDSGFADGPVYSNAVENTIEGDNFSLLVRLNIAELIDGQNEIIQSIGLFESRPDRIRYAPTVRDILSLFGAPQRFGEEETLGLGREVTLRYAGLDVVYFTRIDRSPLDEIPRFYLGNNASQTTPSDLDPWTWFATFSHSERGG